VYILHVIEWTYLMNLHVSVLKSHVNINVCRKSNKTLGFRHRDRRIPQKLDSHRNYRLYSNTLTHELNI
jgi:hypothetical protein